MCLQKADEIEMPNAKFSKVFVAAFLLLASIPALAFASPQVSISPKGLSACACDPVYYDVSVYSGEDDVFEMQFSSDYPFSSFLQPQIPVPRDSSIKTTLVLNTACDAQPGNHSFSVSARGSRGFAAAEGFVVVRSCRNLEISVPAQQSVCSGGSQSILVSLRNSGLVHEEGRVVFENLPKAFYSLASDSFDLNPGASKNFLLLLQPPDGTPPSSFSYNLRANNAVATAGVEIQSCNFQPPDKITLTPSTGRIEFCAGSRKSISLSLKNDGAAAQFGLSASGIPGTFSATKISVSQNAIRTVDFNINAEQLQPGNRTLVLNAFGPASSDTASVNVVLKDCVSAVFGDLELCLGDSGSIPFSFKNNNPSARQYDFTAQSDIPTRVEPKSALLSPNQAVSASLLVTGSALGSYRVFVYANSSILKTPRVIVKQCSQQQLPFAVATKAFEGEAGVEQDFVLQFTQPVREASISLAPGLLSFASARVENGSLVFTATPLVEGNGVVLAAIAADGRRLQENLSFSVRSASVEVREKGQATLSVSGSAVKNELLLTVTNNGASPATLTPSLSAQGASFEPSTLQLAPGESKDLKAVFEATENSTIALKLSSDSGRNYALKTTAVKAPSKTTTGFFTATRTVGLFAVIVVIAIICLAFLIKREFERGSGEGESQPEKQKGTKK
ncbi:MAG TPA: hypothetical protein VI875_03265 [Candidatus Norongarragalinales archaeon]|nr:hypothetical protein [Candidatus Norongarragalinales archaeon]